MAAKTDDSDEDHLLVGSVVKAMKVLEAFDGNRRSMGFSDLARATGLERSAAQRAAHTLWKLGYLEKTPRSGEYRLSIRCHDLGMRFLETQRMVTSSAPYISLLRKKTTASVNLTMLDGPDTVFIQRNPTVESLGNRLGALARIPAYCTATGIAMLSQLPDDQVDQILAVSDLKPIMLNTVWEPEKIKMRIADTRQRQFALGIEEDMANDITIACAFVDGVTQDVGAIGLSFLSETITLDEALAQGRDLLMNIVSKLSSELKS